MYENLDRRDRMLTYAAGRMPETNAGNQLWQILRALVASDQPTPQVSTAPDDGAVCEWMVGGRSVTLWVEEDGLIFYDDDAFDPCPDEENFTAEEIVETLRPLLTEMGKGVKNPLV